MSKTIPTISKNIKKLRKAKDLSQDKLSRENLKVWKRKNWQKN